MISEVRLNEVAEGLQAALCKELGATVVTKEEAGIHTAIAAGFDLAKIGVKSAKDLFGFISFMIPDIGIPTGEQYLTEFSTTIGTEIALPRKLRLPASAAERILTLPHEGTHVDQHNVGVDAGWWPKVTSHSVLYLCSVATDDAAEYLGKVEADAYAVTECLRKWGGYGQRPIASIVESLRQHYALAPAGQQTAENVLLSHYDTMETGGIPNVRVCRFTMDWLNANAPDLKGQMAS